ncbi:hypothetical protein TWF703_002167 [Orbilia oligospora]|uniref:Uncharacterized protein n=1 Tax=Orbilia oligospora TaxID=2813651 RepID=A0A7C8NW88_ORBOL|nr:hypothetical protein TWF703_002167 [Orbilia oligospora]
MYKDESFRLDRKFKNLGAAAPNYTSFQAKKRRSPKTTSVIRAQRSRDLVPP